MNDGETPQRGELSPPDDLDASGFARTFGEPLERVLDLGTWHGGTDLEGLYERLELDAHIGRALAQEDRAAAAIRAEIIPQLRDRTRPSAPPLAGVWSVPLADLEKIHRGTLFAGRVEACDSAVQVHESLALTIIQIGIALVGYCGDEGTWAHRLYRRDLQGIPVNAVELARQLLELRDPHSPQGPDDSRDQITELGRRGITSYAAGSA